jgi:Coenzyme PQQ synthesis protein D (PqqD)
MSHPIQRLLARFRNEKSVADRIVENKGRVCFTPSSDARATVAEDGVVFLHLRSGIVFRSNRVGAAIWRALDRRQDIAAIASDIGREYGVPLEQAARDAMGFITQLEAQGFLTRTSEA